MECDYNFRLTKADAEGPTGIKDFILEEAFYVKYFENPHLSLQEMCDKFDIKPSWVREWATADESWRELLEELDKEPELPRIRIERKFDG